MLPRGKSFGDGLLDRGSVKFSCNVNMRPRRAEVVFVEFLNILDRVSLDHLLRRKHTAIRMIWIQRSPKLLECYWLGLRFLDRQISQLVFLQTVDL